MYLITKKILYENKKSLKSKYFIRYGRYFNKLYGDLYIYRILSTDTDFRKLDAVIFETLDNLFKFLEELEKRGNKDAYR